MAPADVVVLGCGYLGTVVAKRALACGRSVQGSVRTASHAAALRAMGIESVGDVRGADVLVGFPPDGDLDAVTARTVLGARRVVYVSTTGVYGAARGTVDEHTPVEPATPRARVRLASEAIWRDAGATVLRVAGIYGTGRGIHLRIAQGTFRITGDGSNVVSRIHVEDLASAVEAVWHGAHAGETFTVADDAPVPQREAVAWVCAQLGVAMPPSVAVDDAPETLRHDRSVSNRALRAATGLVLRYPTYREGFAACLRADGLIPA